MTSDALGGPTSMSTEGGSMSKLKLNITMSIDGFVAGPDQSPEHPLGVGGEELHDWLVPLKAFRESHGEEGGEVNASTPFAEDILGGAGATIMAGTCSAAARDRGTSRGRAGGETIRPSTIPSSSSLAIRASRWRCRAERRSTS